MERVNQKTGAEIRFPRRHPRRWPFAGGRWFRGRRDVRVVDLTAYRQRRRSALPATSVATTRGESA
ncbi:MAG TPA: hypothetical protein VF158_10815 [Longimicrobiales bacterium]